MSLPQELQGRQSHDAVQTLSWMIGRWRATTGECSYPTIPTMTYAEEIEFRSLGQPLLNYTAFSWHPEKKAPMHMESGFLRTNPGTNKLAFLVAHNFGLTSLEEGEVNDKEIKLTSSNISRMSFAKDPAVMKTERIFRLNGDSLEQVVYMETSSQPMTLHLKVVYSKVS
ncbi:hypothetical protein B566_EDAN012929 [Ephemera danica]|nr:hypothetical protein B566_EDAN012929 [Ephemera danica]